MRKLLLSLFCILFTLYAHASHIQGGQIKYDFNGINYTVDLQLYRDCRGIPLPPTLYIMISSASLGVSIAKPLTIQSTQYTNACPASSSPCINPSNPGTGTEIGWYSDTVNLLPAPDWVISYEENARNGGIINLSGSFGVGMHIEANLDNSSGVNSNAQWPALTNVTIVAGTTASFPIQMVDADADSLDVRLVGAKDVGGTSVPYAPGYSPSNPFGAGGSCSLNTTTNTLDMLATSPGLYVLVIQVNEYRGGVVVGSFVRDFQVTVYGPPAFPPSYPTPSSTTNFTFYTCPGQTNTVTLNFDDAITDSVFVMIDTPSLSGWTFTPVYTSGLGTGSVSLTYTAPVTLNPSATPYILVPLQVRDNACPKTIVDYMVIIRTRTCMADSVWPGDANSDNVVNLYDPLYVALAYSKTGPSRPGATTTWVGQACTDWSTIFPLSGVNHKHADCNGDGVVNIADLGAITANYGLTHPRPGNRTTAGMPLKFDMTGIEFVPGTTVSIPIVLGDASNNVNGLFGMATRVSVSGVTLATTPAVSNITTWMGASTDLFSYNKSISSNIVDWVQAHTDGQTTGGQGVVGTLEFEVPASAVIGTTITLDFSSTLLINVDGNEIPGVSEEQATGLVQWPTSVDNINNSIQNIAVVPNPSVKDASLTFKMLKSGDIGISVTDMTGKIVWHYDHNYEAGSQALKLPADQLSAGVYIIKVTQDKQNIRQLKWSKQ